MPPAGPINDDLPMKCSQFFFNLFIDPFMVTFFILCIFLVPKKCHSYDLELKFHRVGLQS
jgi:hypothetical protein